MISVLILTKNEEQDLPACLESVAWSDDVHVLDSFSSDRTLEIASAAGAKVTQRVFDGYATHRNAGLKGLHFLHDWLLILDADERIPTALKEEMLGIAKRADDSHSAYRIQRRDFLYGTWLKHAQISPFYIRLVRHQRVHYEREVNEVLIVDGSIGELSQPFDHFPFSKGMRHWLDKHNIYSSMEAERWLAENSGEFSFSWKSAFFGKDFNERRYHQKGLFYQFPGRPVLKWFYMMVLRRAFLDGRAGVTYATLQSIYEYFIVLKQREFAQRGQ